MRQEVLSRRNARMYSYTVQYIFIDFARRWTLQKHPIRRYLRVCQSATHAEQSKSPIFDAHVLAGDSFVLTRGKLVPI